MSPLTPYPLAPIGSFFGIMLSVIPVASHLGYHSWNIGIWMYAFWIGTMNIANFVDTIVWRDNVNIIIPVWCDIVTKFQIGAAIGVPACALVLCLHLFRITRMRGVVTMDEKRQRRRLLIFDLVITLGIPLLIMALWIIVQEYRFEIDEEIGCTVVSYSYIAYILYYGPQIAFCAVAAILAPLTLRKFIRHRSEMNEVITNHSDQDVTPNKYTRVMTITCLTLLIDLPLLVILLSTRIISGTFSTWNFPYHSWKYIHDDGSIHLIIQRSADIWGSFKWQVFLLKWNEWIYVLHAIVFFAIFGTTPEAMRRYRRAARCCFATIGLKTKETQPSKEASNIIFNSSPGRPRRKSFRRGTFSFLTSTNLTNDQFTDGTRSNGSKPTRKIYAPVMDLHQTTTISGDASIHSALALGTPEKAHVSEVDIHWHGM